MNLIQKGNFWVTPAIAAIVSALQVPPVFVSVAYMKAEVDKERKQLGSGFVMLKGWDYYQDDSSETITFRNWVRQRGRTLYPGVQPLSEQVMVKSFTLPTTGSLKIELTSPTIVNVRNDDVYVVFRSEQGGFSNSRGITRGAWQDVFGLSELAPEADIGWCAAPLAGTIIFLRSEAQEVRDYYIDEVRQLFEGEVRYINS